MDGDFQHPGMPPISQTGKPAGKLGLSVPPVLN